MYYFMFKLIEKLRKDKKNKWEHLK